ncbi:hypothetical protein HMPREF3038_02485, partial [Akkermansia sp. KLE1797]
EKTPAYHKIKRKQILKIAAGSVPSPLSPPISPYLPLSWQSLINFT